MHEDLYPFCVSFSFAALYISVQGHWLFPNTLHASGIMFDFHSLKGLRIQTRCPVLCTFAQVILSDLKIAASGDCPCYLNKSEEKQLKINNEAKFSTQNLSSRSFSFLKTYEMG